MISDAVKLAIFLGGAVAGAAVAVYADRKLAARRAASKPTRESVTRDIDRVLAKRAPAAKPAVETATPVAEPAVEAATPAAEPAVVVARPTSTTVVLEVALPEEGVLPLRVPAALAEELSSHPERVTFLDGLTVPEVPEFDETGKWLFTENGAVRLLVNSRGEQLLVEQTKPGGAELRIWENGKLQRSRGEVNVGKRVARFLARTRAQAQVLAQEGLS